MTDHTTEAVKAGYCIGFGPTFHARCICGWSGSPQLYRFAAVSDGFGHVQLIAASDAAVAGGAV